MSEQEDRCDEETRSYRVIASGTEVSRYKIIEKLGAGGMGEVYLADDVKLHRKVALKFLLPQYTADEAIKARFIREAQAAAALNHANIITIHEVAEFQGRPYMAMEYVSGRSLKDMIGEGDHSVSRVIGLAMQIGEGLRKAHETGIVHRDVKPQNILVDDDGRVKITDFGLAKVRGEPKLTQAGTTFGTMAYMSPEQAKGVEVDRRADIFSFGVVLYEMITSQLPFKGDNEATIINSIINQVPEPLARYKSQVPEGVQRIIDKALAKDREDRYQHMDDLVADLRRVKKRLELTETTQLLPGAAPALPRRRLLSFLIPAALIVAAVILIFVLEPFRVEMGPEQRAVAEENTLAIMYFENMADREDEARLGEIIADLLITDLSGSQYLNVVSSQRLYDILEILGKEGAKKIDRSVATQVATRAGAKWMLMGSILQTEPQIILTLQLVEVESGKVLASRRVSGDAGETIFSIVDRLTVEIKDNLALPASAEREKDIRVSEVTTSSPEAYRHYLEGVDHFRKIYVPEARESYRRAIEYDSTFAMAYFKLALITTGAEKSEIIAKAMRHLDHVSKKERYYIRSLDAIINGRFDEGIAELETLTQEYPQERDAYQLLGTYYREIYQDPQGALGYLERAVEIDPFYKQAYNVMAYTYNDLGMLEKSLWAINKYIELAPGEPNPHDTKGDLYASNGRLDEAIEAYRMALEVKPDFYYSLAKLGHMRVFKREYAGADSCYRELSSSGQKEWRAGGRLALAFIPVYQGKFEEALHVLDNGLAADRMDNAEDGNVAAKHLLKSKIYLNQGNRDRALEEGEIGVKASQRAYPEDPTHNLHYYAFLLAENGRYADAESVLQQIKVKAEASLPLRINYLYALGLVELAKDNPEAAVAHLEEAGRNLGKKLFESHYLLGLAYLESGRLGEAVAELEAALSGYGEDRLASATIWSVKADYLLGLAYEKSGWGNKAIAEYEAFLEIWKEADPGIPEVDDARKRLAKLKGQA